MPEESIDRSNFVDAEYVAEVVNNQYIIEVHAPSIGASVGATLLILFLLLMIAGCIHSCCFAGTCCQSFWSFILSCCCRRCTGCTMVGREDTGGGGYYGDSIYNDYYASGTAATSWRPNGKSSNALPYDSGYALQNLPTKIPNNSAKSRWHDPCPVDA